MDIVKAVAKNIRRSPRKVRLVTGAISGMNVNDAKDFLKSNDKGASVSVLKLLNSAIANAVHNNSLSEDNLIIVKSITNEGATFKRYKFGGRGRVKPIKRRSSHVEIHLSSKDKKEHNGAKD